MDIKIGHVNEKVGKGRHTTTITTMYPLPSGGYIVDTPGIRELGLYEIEKVELDLFFTEFLPFLNQCHFKQCTHTHEPRCGIQVAVNEKHITQKRYDSYCSILSSMDMK